MASLMGQKPKNDALAELQRSRARGWAMGASTPLYPHLHILPTLPPLKNDRLETIDTRSGTLIPCENLSIALKCVGIKRTITPYIIVVMESPILWR